MVLFLHLILLRHVSSCMRTQWCAGRWHLNPEELWNCLLHHWDVKLDKIHTVSTRPLIIPHHKFSNIWSIIKLHVVRFLLLPVEGVLANGTTLSWPVSRSARSTKVLIRLQGLFVLPVSCINTAIFMWHFVCSHSIPTAMHDRHRKWLPRTNRWFCRQTAHNDYILYRCGVQL